MAVSAKGYAAEADFGALDADDGNPSHSIRPKSQQAGTWRSRRIRPTEATIRRGFRMKKGGPVGPPPKRKIRMDQKLIATPRDNLLKLSELVGQSSVSTGKLVRTVVGPIVNVSPTHSDFV